MSRAASPRAGAARIHGGRKPLSETDETLLEDLNRMLDPVTRHDPMSPLRWTCKGALHAELDETDYETGKAVSLSPR